MKPTAAAKPISVLGRGGVALLVAVVGALSGASAWACVPQPLLVVNPASSAPAGTKASVDGLNFTDAAAEVRWNALDGPLLGSTKGPDFSIDITIPQVPEGLYLLVGIVRGADGSVGETGTASFLVTGNDTVAPPRSTRASPASGAGAGQSQGTGEDSSSALSWSQAAAGAVVAFVLGALAASVLARRRSGASQPASS